jgi:hypothetical protein
MNGRGWVVGLALCIALIGGAGAFPGFAASKEAAVDLVFTSDIDGYIMPCPQ